MPTECSPEYCDTICASIVYYQAAIVYDQAVLAYDQGQYFFWQYESYRCGCSCGMMMAASSTEPPKEVTPDDLEKLRQEVEKAREMMDDARAKMKSV